MSRADGKTVLMIDIALDEENNLQRVEESSSSGGGGGDIGFIYPYAGETIPEGYLLCDGSAISRTEYPELFEAIGVVWGEGDGTTTFNIPDLRGYFLRGTGGTNAAALGVAQSDAMRNFTGYFGVKVFYGNGGTVMADGGIFYTGGLVGGASNNVAAGNDSRQYTSVYLNPGRQVATAAENRPINKAVNYCIRYE